MRKALAGLCSSALKGLGRSCHVVESTAILARPDSFQVACQASTAQVANPPMPPWTPTKDLVKRKVLTKRMGFMMQELEKEQEAQAAAAKGFPQFKAGDVLELKLAIPENKRRVSTFKGLCIAKSNRGWRTTFTLRNSIGTSGGIERTFPLYCPTVLELKVLESRKVRRAKLYYLRERNPKEYRV